MDISALASIVPALAPFVPYLTAAVAVCATLATVLPKPAVDTGVYAGVYRSVNYIALNFGHARNA